MRMKMKMGNFFEKIKKQQQNQVEGNKKKVHYKNESIKTMILNSQED